MRIFFVLAVYVGAFAFAARVADAQTIDSRREPLHPSGGVPRLPNFTGKYICFGVDLPLLKPDWGMPMIESSMQYGGTMAKHRIKFNNDNWIEITERLTTVNECKDVPTNTAQWDIDGRSKFCLKTWKAGRLIRIDLRVSDASITPHGHLYDVLFGIGACDYGDGIDLAGSYLNYGMTLRADLVYLHSPSAEPKAAKK